MEQGEALRELLSTSLVAALGVLEDGAPAVSLVGFTWAEQPLRVFLLVSELSSHTPALRADPRCSLLVHAPPSPEDPRSNHALARVMIRARASFLDRAAAEERGVTAAWRDRYAITDTLLGLADFRFVELVPESATLILGFGKAYRVTGVNLDVFEHVVPDKR